MKIYVILTQYSGHVWSTPLKLKEAHKTLKAAVVDEIAFKQSNGYTRVGC